MRDKPLEKVTKLDAAKRQLKTAIRMFFEDGDTVSIHTLAAAAHEILRDLHRARGEQLGSLKDYIELLPGKQDEARRKANEAENFFKHADRDPDAALEFLPLQTEFLLLDGTLMLERLAGKRLRAGIVFSTWFLLRYPDLAGSDVVAAALGRLQGVLASIPEATERNDFLPFLEGPEYSSGADF